ncbi:hypothetical protein ETH99_10340 [Macrococcoides caseolyticum]|nr:hypothetical protein ETH99_10340 [Macrococcus caseolyticus]
MSLDNEDFKSYNISDNYVKENSYVQGNKKYVTSEYQSENLDVDSKVVYDTDADKITAIASLKDEHGNDVEKKFDIMFLRIVSENDFKAEFTDQSSGEIYIYDTHEVKASAFPLVPVLVGFIAKQGLKMAIKKYGKTVVTTMIRTSPQVAAQAAKNLGYSATKYVSHGKKVFKRNGKGSPKYITPDRDGHNNGAWKGASSVKNLGSKKTRSGTYDANLKRIGD